jgi:drug/metabolite transporter (DMT)-like permease
MIARIVHYHALRRNRLPHKLAWTMSGLRWVALRLRGWAALIIVAAGCLFLMSSAANSAQESTNARVAAAVSDQAAYVAGLERIVAACLSDATGKPITIGGRVFLCSIYDTGEKL